MTLGKALKEPEGAGSVCDKLFYGCNLPAFTPKGKHYAPKWSKSDVTILVAVFASGFALLRENLDSA